MRSTPPKAHSDFSEHPRANPRANPGYRFIYGVISLSLAKLR